MMVFITIIMMTTMMMIMIAMIVTIIKMPMMRMSGGQDGSANSSGIVYIFQSHCIACVAIVTLSCASVSPLTEHAAALHLGQRYVRVLTGTHFARRMSMSLWLGGQHELRVGNSWD
jgi:hypothetical protein